MTDLPRAVLSRSMSRWRAAFLAAVLMALAGLTVGFVTNLVATVILDGSCSRGPCDTGLSSFYLLLTFWTPFAVAAVLTLAWLWRAGRLRSN